MMDAEATAEDDPAYRIPSVSSVRYTNVPLTKINVAFRSQSYFFTKSTLHSQSRSFAMNGKFNPNPMPPRP